MTIFSESPEKAVHLLRLLALSGAPVNAKNNDDLAPLHLAVKRGQVGAVREIVALNRQLAQQRR